MPTGPLKTVEASTAAQWRAWLARHHDSEREVWLIFHKRHTGRACVAYEDAVNEALCFGWIDSLVRRLDDARYARKFTPRKPASRWSPANRKRYARLNADGRLMPPGLERAPSGKGGDVPRPSSGRVPRYIRQAIGRQGAARIFSIAWLRRTSACTSGGSIPPGSRRPALDGRIRNDLYLFPDGDNAGTYLCVGGGGGRYIVSGAIDNNEFPTLANPDVPAEPKQALVVGGQEGSYPGNWVVDLEAALRAARAFYDHGAFTDDVPWIRA